MTGWKSRPEKAQRASVRWQLVQGSWAEGTESYPGGAVVEVSGHGGGDPDGGAVAAAARRPSAAPQPQPGAAPAVAAAGLARPREGLAAAVARMALRPRAGVAAGTSDVPAARRGLSWLQGRE